MAPLADTLKLLGLHHTAEHLADLVALATKRRWSPTQLLEHLADVEPQKRARRSAARNEIQPRRREGLRIVSEMLRGLAGSIFQA